MHITHIFIFRGLSSALHRQFLTSGGIINTTAPFYVRSFFLCTNTQRTNTPRTNTHKLVITTYCVYTFIVRAAHIKRQKKTQKTLFFLFPFVICSTNINKSVKRKKLFHPHQHEKSTWVLSQCRCTLIIKYVSIFEAVFVERKKLHEISFSEKFEYLCE